MNKWKALRIQELVDDEKADIQTGPFGTQLKASEYVSEGIPVINVRNIGYGILFDAQLEYIDSKTADRLKVHRLLEGDIVFGRKGAVDRHVLVTQENEGLIQGSDCLRLRIQSREVLNKFVSYYFITEAHKSWMNAQGSFGATMTSLNQGIIKRISIPLPPLPIQKKITAVLSAYDDLIENNARRIALLEKMAEEIYREWFVRLRFPGHEQVAFHKGIPAGWEVKQLSELVTTQYGYTASAEDEEVGPKFLRITDIVPTVIDWRSVPYCKVPEQELNKYLLHEGDIVVARTGATVGYAKRIHKSHPPSVFASYLVRLKPKNLEESIFLGISVESDNFKDFISQFFTGSAQPQANAKVMTLYPLLYPNENLILKFNQVVDSIFDQKEALLLKNSLLKQTRDRILTRLISGKLSVENLDIQFPPSMAAEAPDDG